MVSAQAGAGTRSTPAVPGARRGSPADGITARSARSRQSRALPAARRSGLPPGSPRHEGLRPGRRRPSRQGTAPDRMERAAGGGGGNCRVAWAGQAGEVTVRRGRGTVTLGLRSPRRVARARAGRRPAGGLGKEGQQGRRRQRNPAFRRLPPGNPAQARLQPAYGCTGKGCPGREKPCRLRAHVQENDRVALPGKQAPLPEAAVRLNRGLGPEHQPRGAVELDVNAGWRTTPRRGPFPLRTCRAWAMAAPGALGVRRARYGSGAATRDTSSPPGSRDSWGQVPRGALNGSDAGRGHPFRSPPAHTMPAGPRVARRCAGGGGGAHRG